MLRMRLKWRLQAAACCCLRSVVRLLVELAGAGFGSGGRFFDGALEAAHCHFKGSFSLDFDDHADWLPEAVFSLSSPIYSRNG